jgi:hypothetical protein
MTSLLVERVRDSGGEAVVAELLRLAGSRRSAEYLCDLANWISYDEAVALWRAGARVTQHPQFARAVGEDAARRHNASPVAALFRSLGSPENVYRQIATSATKYSVVTTLEAVDVGPGFAEIVAVPVEGFVRDADRKCPVQRGAASLGLVPPTSGSHFLRTNVRDALTGVWPAGVKVPLAISFSDVACASSLRPWAVSRTSIVAARCL